MQYWNSRSCDLYLQGPTEIEIAAVVSGITHHGGRGEVSPEDEGPRAHEAGEAADECVAIHGHQVLVLKVDHLVHPLQRACTSTLNACAAIAAVHLCRYSIHLPTFSKYLLHTMLPGSHIAPLHPPPPSIPEKASLCGAE